MSELRLKPSRILLVLTGLVYGLAVLALFWSRLPAPLAILMLLYLSLAGASCRPYLGLQELRFRPGRESCTLAGGHSCRKFCPPQIDYLGEWLIILTLQPYPGQDQTDVKLLAGLRSAARARKLLILADSLSAADNWQLRRYLRACLEDQQCLTGN